MQYQPLTSIGMSIRTCTHIYATHKLSRISLIFPHVSVGIWNMTVLLTKTVRPKPWNGKRERQLAPHNLPEATLQPFMWATGVVSPWHPHLWWKQASCSAVSEHYVERTAVPFFPSIKPFQRVPAAPVHAQHWVAAGLEGATMKAKHLALVLVLSFNESVQERHSV